MSNITKDEMEFQEAVVQVRKTKRKKKIILTVIATTVVLAILAGVFSYGYKASENNSQKEITEAQAEADMRMMEGIEDFDEYYESQRCIDPDELWKDYDPEEDPSNSYCDFIPLEEKKGYVQYVVDRTYEELASMLAEG